MQIRSPRAATAGGARSANADMRSGGLVDVAAVAVAVVVWIGVVAPCAADSPAAALLQGVSEIAAPGVPGAMVAFGEDAWPIVVGGGAGETRLPVVVAAKLGRGRIVGFGHNGYFGGETLRTADTGRLMNNAIRWAAGERRGEKPIRVGVFDNALAEHFSAPAGGFAVVVLQPQDWTARLDELDAICVTRSELDAQQSAALKRFVRRGGGLLAGVTGWGWRQLNRDRPLSENALNALVAEAGMVWSSATLSRTSPQGYAAASPPDGLCHAGAAIEALIDQADGQRTLDAKQLHQAGAAATDGAHCIPRDDKLLRPKLDRLLKSRAAALVPTEQAPFGPDRALERLLLALQLDAHDALRPDEVPEHAAAGDFPGAAADGARFVSRKLTIDAHVPDWHSTGLYAAAGEAITVRVPSAAAKGGLAVRIGAHTDELWHHGEWKRVPRIWTRVALDSPSTRVASAFGGLIYIDVPRGCKLGDVSVEIEHAIAAPLFVLGDTSPADWAREIRERPAPWAELASSKVIVTVPSSAIRTLDDPTAVLRLWERIADAAAELAMRPLERERPERYVADRQISAGYMHAGYPIMTHLDAAEDMVGAERLGRGSWGLFHELGHNHQSGDWTFEGTGEVTVNLFSMYIMQKVCGVGVRDGHGAIKEQPRNLTRHVTLGASFELWKSDPFLALLMYIQLQEAFGWEAYQRVFAEYRDLPGDQRPKNDDEKRDQWLVRMSRTVGRNLGPFFQAWGVPTSEAARASVAGLPEWMPPDFPAR